MRLVVISFAALAVTGILWASAAQEKKAEPAKQNEAKKELKFVSSDDAKFVEVVPGVSKVVLRGDPEKGAYAAFTKFAPGQNNGLHTHSNEVRIVVLEGAYIYAPEKGEERRVGPGCYLSIPGGDRHVSSGDEKEGALFFEESDGKFDLVSAETEKK